LRYGALAVTEYLGRTIFNVFRGANRV
jgi:hypothetical protein